MWEGGGSFWVYHGLPHSSCTIMATPLTSSDLPHGDTRGIRKNADVSHVLRRNVCQRSLVQTQSFNVKNLNTTLRYTVNTLYVQTCIIYTLTITYPSNASVSSAVSSDVSVEEKAPAFLAFCEAGDFPWSRACLIQHRTSLSACDQQGRCVGWFKHSGLRIGYKSHGVFRRIQIPWNGRHKIMGIRITCHVCSNKRFCTTSSDT